MLNKNNISLLCKKAWKALASFVNQDGMLGNVQPIGAAPQKVDVNSTDTYGVRHFY